MTTLIQRMREELVRRNYAATTIQSYLKAVEHFREYINSPLDQLGPDDIRSYHAHLLQDRKLAVNTVVLNVCALRFLYIRVLKRRDMKEDLPYPKQRQRLPVILSPGEVAQLIGAASNLYHRTILMTLYSTGLRRAELCRLKVSDIDSKRMMLRVVEGKGGIDREIPLEQETACSLARVLPLDAPGDLSVPRYGEPFARRQADYAEGRLASCPRSLHPRRDQETGVAAQHSPLLRNSPSGVRRRSEEHSDDARPLGSGSDHSLPTPFQAASPGYG